jgi:hypothetical protein
MSNIPDPIIVDATGVGDNATFPLGTGPYARTVGGQARLVIPDGVTPGGVQHATKPEVDGKPERFPSQPFVALTSKYLRAHGNYVLRFWYGAGNHIYSIPADGGSPINGQANTASPNARTGGWTFAVTSQPLYDRWQIARQMGDATTQATLASMIASNWAFFQTSWTVAQIKAMATASGIIYSSDDAFHILVYLREVCEVTADATAQACLIEAFANTYAGFLDPLQTGANLIDSGYTTPGGTRFKWNQWGILYNPDFKTWGCQSSIYEARAAGVAAWMCQQAWVPAAYAAALRTYALSRADFYPATMRSPAPATPTKAVQGIYGGGLELDPNVNANNNAAVNGGAALSGSYDANQRYHTVHNGYFDRNIRSISAWHDGGTIWVANLQYDAYKLTGTAKYLAEFNSICTAYIDRNGFGRTFDGTSGFGNLSSLVDPSGAGNAYNGVVCFANTADPWTDGMDYGRFMRRVREADAAGLGDYSGIKRAFCVTARMIAAQSTRGFLTADWSGDEWCFLDSTNNWIEAHTKGFGGNPSIPGTGFGNPKAGMTTACALVVMSAAAQLAIANDPAVMQSGLSSAVAIETLAAELPAILASLASKLGNAGGGTLANPIAVGKGGLRIGYDSIGTPCFFFDDTNAYLRYDYNNGYLAFWQNVNGSIVEQFRWARDGFTAFGKSYIKGLQYGDSDFHTGGSVSCAEGATSSQLYLSANAAGSPGLNLGFPGCFINAAAGYVQIGVANSVRIRFQSDGAYVTGNLIHQGDAIPQTDNTSSLGGNTNRYRQVYSVNTTIQTSDEREKTWIASGLSDAEYRAGLRVLKEIGTFRWIEDGDRIHFGVRAQQVWAIFNDEGMNPGNSLTRTPYSFLTYEAWDAKPGEPAIEAIEEESRIEDRDMGDGTTMPVRVVTREGVAGRDAVAPIAAGDRYGVRQEINAFLIAVTARHQDEQDARIAALEAK